MLCRRLRSGVRSRSPNFKSALIQQFNLQLEQQVDANVFSIGYIGNIGQHLPESINNINQPSPFNPLYPTAAPKIRPGEYINFRPSFPI